MTGFGRAEGVINERKVTIEVRSLNSKQLDLSVRMPPIYRERDAELRQWAGERITRGKAELNVASEPANASRQGRFDATLIAGYYNELKGIAQTIDPDLRSDLLGHVLRMPEVAAAGQQALNEGHWEAVMRLAADALASFNAFREAEGRKLAGDLRARVERIEQLLNEVAEQDRGRLERTRERLQAKLSDLRTAVDPARFEQELVFYLEKFDINEEKVRLHTHCHYFLETLDREDLQGRKLGFIGQEMGREINTIGSKANDAAMQRLVVLMKDELEKVKEQVMNVL